jgi:hypothetical protein
MARLLFSSTLVLHMKKIMTVHEGSLKFTAADQFLFNPDPNKQIFDQLLVKNFSI